MAPRGARATLVALLVGGRVIGTLSQIARSPGIASHPAPGAGWLPIYSYPPFFGLWTR